MANKEKLKVTVNSFSYKRGIPYDGSGNGGGFVFDCRSILNPGKFERYMMLDGKDPEVVDFFHKNTNVDRFLEYVLSLLEISIKEYTTRGFTNLMVNFGCTGGQHRSVFCAEQITRQIRETYDVAVELNHLDLKA